MQNLEEFILATINAQTDWQAFGLYTAFVGAYGYDQVVYSLITDHPTMNKKAGHGLLASYPEDWLKYYDEKGYRYVDPVPKHAFRITTPFTWRDMETQKSLTRAELRVMREAEDAGLNSGVGIPLYGPRNEIAGVGLASRTGKLYPTRQHLHEVRTATLHFHMIYGERQGAEPQFTEVALSKREHDVMHWLAEGKSLPDIAQILTISHSTVKFHLKNCYRKLGVNQQTLAVCKAISLGLVTPVTIRL